jgi:hypothetical protein
MSRIEKENPMTIKNVLIISVSILLVLVLVVAFIFYVLHWIPEKYAVKEEDFSRYESYILIKETWHTGTKWEKIGDEAGYFSSRGIAIEDVVLTGEELPHAHTGNCVNTFLCVVEYEGSVEHGAFDRPIDSYRILEWYPVCPVARNSLWPSWILPSEFMTKNELFWY